MELREYTRDEMREACRVNYNAAVEAAARISEEAMVGSFCPYGRDKPGDPTWNNTDKDLCPVCGADGEGSLFKCHDTMSGRIAARIRELTVGDAAWNRRADRVQEVEAENARLRQELAIILDAIESAPWRECEGERMKRIWIAPSAFARLRAALAGKENADG